MNKKERIALIKELESELAYGRFIHTLDVAATASNLAMCYGSDLDQAETAGLLHDCAKCMNLSKMLKLCDKAGVAISEYERNSASLLHSKAGAVLAESRYGVSDEDILSGALASINAWRTFFSNTPGMMQWKRWLIERLQERAFNTLRAEHRHGVLAYCNNLLVASPSPDFASRNITLLKVLAEIKCETHCADCTTLFDPSSSNPYHNLDELFSSQVSDDNVLGLSLPVSKDRIYCFRNIWALLEPGWEYVLKKLVGCFKGLRYEDLEEVYNDGCLVLWEKMMDKEFKMREKSLVGYLFVICRNIA